MTTDTEKILDSLTLDDMIGQMLCFLMPRKATEEQIEKIVSHTKAGSFFVSANGRGELSNAPK